MGKPACCRRGEYAGRTTVDPLDADASLTYSYTGVQQRSVTRVKTGQGDVTSVQRIVPWYIVKAGSDRGDTIEAAACSLTVRTDSDDFDLACEWLDVSGRIYMEA